MEHQYKSAQHVEIEWINEADVKEEPPDTNRDEFYDELIVKEEYDDPLEVNISSNPDEIHNRTTLIKIEPKEEASNAMYHIEIKEEIDEEIDVEERFVCSDVIKQEPTVPSTSIEKVEHTDGMIGDFLNARSCLDFEEAKVRAENTTKSAATTSGQSEQGIEKKNVPKTSNTGSRPYECNMCDYNTDVKRNLRWHMQKHSTHIFKCDYCTFSTNIRYRMIYHLNKHTSEPKGQGQNEKLTNTKPFKCNKCDYSTFYRGYLNKHVLNHSKVLIKCEFCDYKSNNKYYLNKHAMVHQNNKFKCNLCDYSTKNKYSLNKHSKRHVVIEEGNFFKCDLCDYKNVLLSLVKKHQLKHSKEEPYKCKICGYSARYMDRLEKHAKTHTEDYKKKSISRRRFECDYCGTRKRFKSNLIAHIRVHTGEQPFNCNICDKKFNQQINLKKHSVLKHSAAKLKTFDCDQCDYKSSLKENLQRHYRLHTDERPFECDLCDYKSRDKSSLIVHRRKHTGELPYECNLCDYKARDASALRSHVKSHACKYCGEVFKLRENLKKHRSMHSGSKVTKASGLAKLVLP